MKGKISFAIKNKHISFKFDLERNITIITGDSGTGKTKLVNMVRAYSIEGKNSGVTLKCNMPCVVLESINWDLQLDGIKNSIVFIDEGAKFVASHEFAKAIKSTDNYYVIVTRDDLPQIPYSIDSIKQIVKNGKNPKIEKIYKNVGIIDITRRKYDLIVVEDSNTGFQFFTKVGDKLQSNVISANGKSNILNLINEQKIERILVIADAAAFGSEIHNLMQYIGLSNKKIDLFLPESFEWLILKSSIFNNHDNIQQVLLNPIDFIECEKYFNWERYFTDLLVNESKDMAKLKYPKTKKKLPSGYMTEANIDSIINAMK